MKKHIGVTALLAGAVFMLGLVACNNNPEPEPAQKEETVKGFVLKTGFEINDIFRNEEKLNAVDATAFAKATEPPAKATFYLDINKKNVPVWYDKTNTTIYYYVEPGNKLILNEDSSLLFSGADIGEKALFTSIDTTDFDTSNVTNMEKMFYCCTKIENLDVSNFNTSNVTNFKYMFYRCEALKSIDVSHFNTSKATDMGKMFRLCKTLTAIDISNFDTSNVTNMDEMFYCCEKLKNLDVTNFDTSKVTNMRYMFSNLQNLTSIDVSKFNTENVTNMESMFAYSNYETIDMSSFNMNAVTNMGMMFRNCNNLTTIYVAENTDLNKNTVTYSQDMFRNCPELVGGNGTVFDSSIINKTYARVDSADAPGYFTAKN